jgi:hypothetical protein
MNFTKMGVNTCDSEDEAVPAPLVAPVMLLLSNTVLYLELVYYISDFLFSSTIEASFV